MKKVLIILIVILVLVYALICTLVWIFQEKLLFHPNKLAFDHTFRFEQKFDEVFLNTGDGQQIHALHFKTGTEQAKGVVLYFHGNAGALDSWGMLAGDFVSRNHDLFIIDYRGYGKSTGNIHREKQLHKDARLAYDHLIKTYLPNDVVIYGRSIGSGIAAKLAKDVAPAKLILETPYFSLIELTDHYAGFLPNSILSRYKLQTNKWLPDVKCPVFIIHGTADQVIPFSQAEKLSQVKHPEIRFIPVEGGTHNNLGEFGEYLEMLDIAL